MSYGSDLTGDIRNGPLCRADGIRVASVGPADGLQYWDHTCPGAHALDAVELTVVGARSTIKQSSATYWAARARTEKTTGKEQRTAAATVPYYNHADESRNDRRKRGIVRDVVLLVYVVANVFGGEATKTKPPAAPPGQGAVVRRTW